MSDTHPLADNPLFRAMMAFYEAEARYSASGDAVDRASLLETLDPDLVLHQPASLPYGGVWRGREGFVEWLALFVSCWRDIVPAEAVFHVAGEDTLIATVTMRATSRDTGEQISMPMCQVIRFNAGRPVEWRNFAWDTAAMLKALGLTARPASEGSADRSVGPRFGHNTAESA